MEFTKAVMNRHSTRDFSDTPVEVTELRENRRYCQNDSVMGQ